MRIYVAAKWEERAHAQHVMEVLTVRGHQITYDWTRSDEISPAQALADQAGVERADVLVVLADKELPYKGTYVELGIALARRIPVLLVGRGMDACIFVQCPTVRRFPALSHMLASPVFTDPSKGAQS